MSSGMLDQNEELFPKKIKIQSFNEDRICEHCEFRTTNERLLITHIKSAHPEFVSNKSDPSDLSSSCENTPGIHKDSVNHTLNPLEYMANKLGTSKDQNNSKFSSSTPAQNLNTESTKNKSKSNVRIQGNIEK